MEAKKRITTGNSIYNSCSGVFGRWRHIPWNMFQIMAVTISTRSLDSPLRPQKFKGSQLVRQ